MNYYNSKKQHAVVTSATFSRRTYVTLRSTVEFRYVLHTTQCCCDVVNSTRKVDWGSDAALAVGRKGGFVDNLELNR